MTARSVFTLGASALLFASTALIAQSKSGGDAPWMRTGPTADPGSPVAENQWDPLPADPLAGDNSPDALSGTVSIQELQHKVARKAAREFDKGAGERAKGHLDQAIDHFEKAVGYDPEFVPARNNLAAVYLIRSHPELAAQQLEAAIRVDPHAGIPYSNLAVSYMMMNRLKDAERAARQARDLDRASGMRPNMILGMVLVMQNKFTDEAARLLDRAKIEFPQAYLLHARLLAARGKLTDAKADLQTYMNKEREDQSALELAHKWMQTLSDVSTNANGFR